MVRIAWGTDWHLDHASGERRGEFLAALAGKEADALVVVAPGLLRRMARRQSGSAVATVRERYLTKGY